MTPANKRGLVLSGGGAKGAFQAGVLSALCRNGIQFDFIVGTSVGALNAAAMAFAGIDELVSIWSRIRKSDVFLDQWWKLPFGGRGRYSLKPLSRLVDELIKKKKPDLPEAIVCYVDLRDTSAHYFSSNSHTTDFAKAVLASSSIPFYMEPVDKYLVDGGVREVCPIQFAVDKLCGNGSLHVVTCQPIGPAAQDPFEESWPVSVSLGLRALDIRDHETLMNDIDALDDECGVGVTLYSPSEYLYGTFDFSRKSLDRGFNLGVEAVESGGFVCR